MSDTNRVKIRYFRTKSTNNQPKSKGFPVGCLAFQIDYENCVVKYGLSAYNPHDPFDRHVAREVAEGRCVQNPSKFFYDIKGSKTADILHDLMLVLGKDKATPNRIRRVIPLMIDALNSEAKHETAQN